MPELPEVEVVRSTLQKKILGKKFAAPILHIPTTVAYPAPEKFSYDLNGRLVEQVGRKGKYLLINLDRGILVVHLRMTGNLIFSKNGELKEDRFLRLSLPFTDGSALYYSDMRRFGRLWLVKSEADLKEKVLARLGPDLLNEMDRTTFCRLLESKKRRRLKALLLDQQFASGMGNIYTDECLYRCGFHPKQTVESLNLAEKEKLFDTILAVLEEGIKYGGTSVRDYRNASGALGDFQSRLNVYGRRGERCRNCGSTIEKDTVAGRGTYYCPGCQKEEK